MNKPQYQISHYPHKYITSGVLPQQAFQTADVNSHSPASTARKTILAEQESPVQQPDSSSIIPSTNQLRFYQEYKKIYTVSHHLTLEKNRQNALFEDLIKRLKILENKMRDVKERENLRKDNISEETKAKRSRRTAEQIEKHFKCEAAYCDRQYGSQGSLQQHIKLKHPELYQPRDVSISDCLRDNESM